MFLTHDSLSLLDSLQEARKLWEELKRMVKGALTAIKEARSAQVRRSRG